MCVVQTEWLFPGCRCSTVSRVSVRTSRDHDASFRRLSDIRICRCARGIGVAVCAVGRESSTLESGDEQPSSSLMRSERKVEYAESGGLQIAYKSSARVQGHRRQPSRVPYLVSRVILS